MVENDYLKKRKIKLTLIFTLIIFLVLILSEVSFLGFKYFSYLNSELSRLDKSSNRIAERVVAMQQMVESVDEQVDSLFGKGFMRHDRGNRDYPGIISIPLPRGPNNEETVFIMNETGNVLFTSLQDESFKAHLINGIRTKDITANSNYFTFTGYSFVYILKPIPTKFGITNVLVFTPSQISLAEIGIEFLNYLLLSIVLCGFLYFLGYRFVSYNLKPVEDNMKDMQSFIHNAGHELKTPISVVSSSLQLSKLQKNYDEAINESLAELNRMNSLIESLIQLSTISSSIQSTTVNINESINKISKYFTNQLEIKNITLSIKQIATISVFANQDYFDILVTNLLANAIKYNKNGGKIDILIDKKYIQISDTGIGIKQENLKNVFDRFFQEQENRGDGFGIGLSLVKKICDIYKRKVELKSVVGEGTTIKILF